MEPFKQYKAHKSGLHLNHNHTANHLGG